MTLEYGRYKCNANHKDCFYRGWMTESEKNEHIKQYPDHAKSIYDSKLATAKQYSIDSVAKFDEMQKSVSDSFGGGRNVPLVSSDNFDPKE